MRLNDPTMQGSFESIFPKDHPKNTRFSINFFTSIGLGGITESEGVLEERATAYNAAAEACILRLRIKQIRIWFRKQIRI
jgi:hypothetical protein